MTAISMNDKLAVMAQLDVIITVGGNVFTVPAATPFTALGTIDVPVGTVLAIMYEASAQKGKVIQVFSFDEIITVT